MSLKERWERVVLMLLIFAAPDVYYKFAIGEMVEPFMARGWKMAPPSEER